MSRRKKPLSSDKLLRKQLHALGLKGILLAGCTPEYIGALSIWCDRQLERDPKKRSPLPYWPEEMFHPARRIFASLAQIAADNLNPGYAYLAPGIEEEVLACAKGSWQEQVLYGRARHDCKDLKGSASQYFFRYQESLANLEGRLMAAGFEVDWIGHPVGGSVMAVRRAKVES